MLIILSSIIYLYNLLWVKAFWLNWFCGSVSKSLHVYFIPTIKLDYSSGDRGLQVESSTFQVEMCQAQSCCPAVQKVFEIQVVLLVIRLRQLVQDTMTYSAISNSPRLCSLAQNPSKKLWDCTSGRIHFASMHAWVVRNFFLKVALFIVFIHCWFHSLVLSSQIIFFPF